MRRSRSWKHQPPHHQVEIARSDLTDGLVFAALPLGARYIDLVTGLVSSDADAGNPTTYYASASNGGAVRPSEWAAAPITANSITSGQKWPVQATGVDRIVTTGTLLALHGVVPATNSLYAAFGSQEYVDFGYGLIVGIDKFSSEGYGRVSIQARLAFYTSNNDDAVRHEPEGKLHFYGAGFDSGKVYFYSSGLGLTRAEESGSPIATDHASRQTWIGRTAAGASGGWLGLQNYVGLALAWNRVLSLDEYTRLWFNPWHVFARRQRRIYVAAAAAATFNAAWNASANTVVHTGALH